jgi:hypothetical protein
MGRNREKAGYDSGFQQTLAILRPGLRYSIATWHHLSGRTGYAVKQTRVWASLAAASPEQKVQTQPEVSPEPISSNPGDRPIN